MTDAVYLGDHVAVVRTVLDQKMYVDTLDTIAGAHLLLDGQWEPWIAKFLERAIAPGSVFLDIGAHLGWYTLMAHKLGCSFVYAYEPNLRIHNLLRRTLHLNGLTDRTRLRQAALSDRTGMTTLVVPTEWSANAKIGGHGDWTADTVRIPVAMTTIDQELADGNLAPVDFVKIDAEGQETRILSAADLLLSSCPRLQLLVEHHHEADAVAREVEVFGRMKSEFGFEMAVVEHDGSIRLLSLDELATLPDSEMIYFARPR